MSEEIIIDVPCPGAVVIEVEGVAPPVTVNAPTLGEPGPEGEDGEDGAPGGIFSTTSKSATYAILETDSVILCSGTFTVTLPAAANVPGKAFTVKNTFTGTITVDGSENIDGQSSVDVGQLESLTLLSDGTQYWII